MFSEIMASAALVISAYATWKTIRFNKRQEAFIESQEKLNTQLLKRQTSESEDAQKANLSARFISSGPNKYKLKIYNQGKASARNIQIEFPDDDSIFLKSEINEKFPHERMDTYDSIELIAPRSMGNKSKYAIELTWEDDFSNNNRKTCYPTF